MLQDGFHQSFTTLFLLIKEQNRKREKAGPESALWNHSVLENEPDKLEMLKAYLTKAEDAERKSKNTTSMLRAFGANGSLNIIFYIQLNTNVINPDMLDFQTLSVIPKTVYGKMGRSALSCEIQVQWRPLR